MQQYLSGDALLQQASYDSEGNRWLRITSAGGGTALFTLRDAAGQMVADYEVQSADEVPSLSNTIYILYQQPQSIPNILLPNRPAGAGHGQ